MAEHADNPAGTDGFEFVEYAAPEPAALARLFERLGAPRAGDDMAFDFAALIAHAAKTRPLGAGTIIGSGTVSNADAARGFRCILERRAVETAEGGRATTPFLRFGDRVRIDMRDRAGDSVFGAIEQEVVDDASPG